jgi:hypothetical protein
MTDGSPRLLESIKGQSPVLIALVIVLGYLYYEGVQARAERDDIRDQVSKIFATCKNSP